MPADQTVAPTWVNNRNYNPQSNILSFGSSAVSASVLPIEEEAERSFLGIVFLLSANDPHHADLNQFLPWIESEDFYHIKHAYIHRAMLRIWERKEVVAIDTVASELSKHHLLSNVGGSEYLAQLARVSNLHLETYAHMVKRASALRFIMATGQQISAVDPTQDVASVWKRVDELSRAMALRVSALSPNSVQGDVVAEQSVQQILEEANNPNYEAGYSTGFQALDQGLAFMSRKKVFLVAAPTGGGKSAFCLNVAMNVVRRYPESRLLYIALEDDEPTLMERILSSECDIDVRNIRPRRFTPEQYQRLLTKPRELKPLLERLEFSCMIMPTIAAIETRILGSIRNGCTGVIIDWLGGRTVSSENMNQPENRLTDDIYSWLRQFKLESELPFLVSVQMNRDFAKRSDPRPQLSDLAWSSMIEKTSDTVLFIYNAFHIAGDEMADPESGEFIIRKSRGIGEFSVPVRDLTHKYSRFQEGYGTKAIDLALL